MAAVHALTTEDIDVEADTVGGHALRARSHPPLGTSEANWFQMCFFAFFFVQMERMEKSMDSLKGKFSTIRTGRANPAILDRIQVNLALCPMRKPAPGACSGRLLCLGSLRVFGAICHIPVHHQHLECSAAELAISSCALT